MTIGIDASRANNTQKTGVEWYAFFLIEELKKITPPEIKVILYSEKPLVGELAVLPPNWSSKVLAWPPKRLWTQLCLSFEMLMHAPDVLFIPAHVFPLIHPKKTVMTVHDVAALRFPHSYNWFERWYSLWSAKYAVKNLWKVIAPSQFTKDELFSLTQKNQNIEVVYHGYDERYNIRKDQKEIENILHKYKIEKPFLLSLGRIEEKKNTVRTIEAFNALKPEYPELKLVLVGKPGYGYEKVERAIAESPYKKDILRPGYVEQVDIASIMQATEVFVFPSLYEGFGIPILEAFASRTPVVTSKNNSCEEISGGAAREVDPLSSVDIQQAIDQILQDKSLQQNCIDAGQKRVQDFSWQKCAASTLKVLTSNQT
jgi:glycosyltransferase involved in cell wall biosynthesis